MKTIFNLLIILSVFITLFIACKGKDGEVGPTGPTDSNIGLKKDGGTVSGLISSESSEGAQLFNFNFEYNFEGNVFDGTSLSIAYVKDFVNGYSNARDYVYMKMNTSSLNTAPTTYSINMAALNDKGDGTAFQFKGNDSGDASIDETNSTISDWNYDTNKRTVSFSLITNTGYKGNNGKDASVTITVANVPITTVFFRKQ